MPSPYDVVSGRAVDTIHPVQAPPPSTVGLESTGTYKSFSLVLQAIATRFELDEMCNLWDRDVIVSFDLHIGGQLLSPFLQGDVRSQIRSLNRQVRNSQDMADANRKFQLLSEVVLLVPRLMNGEDSKLSLLIV